MPQNSEPKSSIREMVKIRPAEPGDLNFIINSWLKAFKYSGAHVNRMRDMVYYQTYEPIVKDLIKRSDIYVASLREDPLVIVGYLAIERPKDFDIIHFCLVKELWRKMGVAKYLLHAAHPNPYAFFTHWTKPVESLVNKIPYVYNPFLIEKGHHGNARAAKETRTPA